MTAFDRIPGESIDSLAVLVPDPDLWGSYPAQAMQTASGPGDDSLGRAPLRAEDISVSDLFSASRSLETTRQENVLGDAAPATAVPGDPDLAMLALSGAGLWDTGFAPPLTAGLSMALSGSSGLSGSGHQPAEVQVGSPAATPAAFPSFSEPTTASTPDFSASFTGLAAATPAPSVAFRSQLSAYVASTFPDGRIMDDGLPPSSFSAPGSGSAGMVVSQVYADGGQMGSQFRQDYVELFNRGTSSVNLSGWSVQYANAGSGTWQVAALSGTVAPGQYYLVQCWSGPNGLGNIPTADATSSINLGDSAGKVALVNSTTPLVGAVPSGPTIVDLVGYGTADAYEGSGPAPAGSTTLATLRDNGGLDDTDDNSYDFTADTPAPRNSASAFANLPPVNTVPDSQTTPQDTALVFSTANGNALSVSDYDAGSSPVEVSLSATDGTLTLPTTAGLTFSQGDGSGDADMTFTGTVSAVNTALNGLSFAPAAGYRGPAVVGIATDDLGNTGAGGSQFGIGVVLVSVGGPLVAVDDSFATWEDTATDLDVVGNDAFVHGDSLALTILSGPAHGQATVNDNGTPETFDDFITYTPDPNYSGDDSLTYHVTDGYNNSATASVALSVVAINDARIVPPPDQGDQEGDSVSLQLETPDNSGVPLTFSVTGLPAGLSIVSNTGVISGRPLYSDAETSDGVYNVSVTATGGGESDTESFTWYITDANRIDLIDDQASRAGQVVSFQPVVNDQLGNTLTYSATGLPGGLSINSSTGLVSGTVAAQPPGITDFTTTITATGGGDSDSRTFTWHVLSGSSPIILFAVNNTLRTDDDVTLVNPQLPLDVRVTLYAPGTTGLQNVSLMVTGPSSLNTSMVQLHDGESTTVVLTPQQVSQVEDDVMLMAFAGMPLQQVGMAEETNMQKIEITTAMGMNVNLIRAANTPYGMWVDRIPPRVKTPYSIKFVGPALQNKKFCFTILGQSNDNGRASLRSRDPSDGTLYRTLTPGDFNEVYNSNLQGTKQTEPDHHNQLQFAVFRDGEETDPDKALQVSGRFSVVAIPDKIIMSDAERMFGLNYSSKPNLIKIRFGAKYKSTIVSDSGDEYQDDLGKVKISEKIILVSKSGIFAGLDEQTGTFEKGTSRRLMDYMGLETGITAVQGGKRVRLTEARDAVIEDYTKDAKKVADDGKKSKATLVQYFVFSDARTGLTEAAPAKVPNSGFQITYEVTIGGDGVAVMKVQKKPLANNNVNAGEMPQAAQQLISDRLE